jgi:hypothetical protein
MRVEGRDQDRRKMLNPQNLVTAYGLARMRKENLTIMRRTWKPSSNEFQNRNIMSVQPKVENRLVFIQKLTSAHVKEKRDKGLCF